MIWSATTGMTRLIYTYSVSDPVDALAWSPDGKEIAISGRATDVQVWNTHSSKLLLVYHGHSQDVDALAWSPNGKYIASGSWDNTVQIWDAKTGTNSFTYGDIPILSMP
ncbi:WD40 repeat domain-containing protein [Dictyobacter kobayashii]|uniref:Uncharacterized protein n=1 Tax=Dictyobacter kobayashii TaxID=2014872 RepID=A0A402AQM0_9CHLR|nr:PD40 domain-containing protein [Dictyobacter kobayashii]GCE21359.1 hypothetical protein KDK_51590 [Dictyobacter kobayashii]